MNMIRRGLMINNNGKLYINGIKTPYDEEFENMRSLIKEEIFKILFTQKDLEHNEMLRELKSKDV